MRYNTDKNEINYPITLLKGIVFSLIITVILIIVLALILTYTSLSEGIIPIVNSIIMILSIALGSIYVSVKINRLGWLNGALTGLLYILILVILGNMFVDSFKLDIFILFRILIALITGAVGGMIGINLR